MKTGLQIPKRLSALLVYGRPPLVFGGLVCALGVMWSLDSNLYVLGVILLFISMCFDIVDGWFADRYRIHSVLAYLADRVMDKVVSSIIFPLVAVGTMWRLHFIVVNPSRAELLHAIFILLLCVTVSIRDSFANFIRLAGARSGGRIQYEIISLGNSDPVLGYPPTPVGITAAEWNRIAAANNRVEIAILPDVR